MPDFLLHAALAGCMLAALAGPLGAFVVWRRMAYFGDTLAHSALLGIALGLILAIRPELAILLTALALALVLTALQHHPTTATDTLLGILAHGSLAAGLVLIGLFAPVRVDLYAYLFGDLLAIRPVQLLWTGLGCGAGLLVLAAAWNPLLRLTLHEELAAAEGLPVARYRLLLMLLTALVVALAMKAVGVLLITALLIIPPATARHFARSPEQMAVLSALLGSLAVLAGLAGAWWLDAPAGPSVVTAATAFFFLSLPRAVSGATMR